MPSFNQSFKEEVARLARKEVKSELDSLASKGAQYRRDIAALKRQVVELERRVSFLEKREKERLGKAPASESGDRQIRFSAEWLKKHREKTGLSAEDYGCLIDVSAQSIYSWERGKSMPRRAQIEKLAAIRGIGPREAIRRLELLDS
ncbi:MAG: helix-turn-helix domain-containing protein [Desulfobacterales bacterium]|nr:helix-turn-helix domain-containing protein [Desulfobacterales bacterium]